MAVKNLQCVLFIKIFRNLAQEIIFFFLIKKNFLMIRIDRICSIRATADLYTYNNGWNMCGRIVSHFTRTSYCNICICRILCCATLLFCNRALTNMMVIQVDKVLYFNEIIEIVRSNIARVQFHYRSTSGHALKLRYQPLMFVRFVATLTFYRFSILYSSIRYHKVNNQLRIVLRIVNLQFFCKVKIR